MEHKCKIRSSPEENEILYLMYFCFLFTLFILYLMLNNYFTDIYCLPKKKFPIMCSNYCMRIFEKQCNSQKREPWWVTGTQSTCWNFSWPDHCCSFDYFWPFFQLKWGNKHFHFSSGWWAKFVSGAESVLLVEQSKCSMGKLWVRFLFLYLCFTLSLFVFHS